MKTSDLPYAIEALGFDEESIRIRKHIDYHYNILQLTFLRKSHAYLEGIGSKFEGLEDGIYGRSCLVDMDIVHNFTEIYFDCSTTSDISSKLETLIIAEKDFVIIPCRNFQGYVLLNLLTSNLECDLIHNNHENLNNFKKTREIRLAKKKQNGPALTLYLDYGGIPMIQKKDFVNCYAYESWPVEASKWVNRNRPNGWPSKYLIDKITSKGFNLAPVGHYDCSEKHLQWRIGIRGEKELMSNLSQTQILCYIALKLILKGDIKQIHEDALSSYHMKNLIFWSVEQDSCQWTNENFEICLKTCINRLIRFIKCKQFPHYFIEDRNLINSKMTPELKEKIIKTLTKYSDDIILLLSLSCFDELKKLTNFNVEMLNCAIQKSIIFTCIEMYFDASSHFYIEPNILWETYEGRNTDINLKNAESILSILERQKMHFIRHHIAYAKNMLGLLYYSRYIQTHCLNDNEKASELLEGSLSFENIAIKCRVATFHFMKKEFENCFCACNTLLKNNSKFKSLKEKRLHVLTVLSQIWIMIDNNRNDVTYLTELKEKILAIFYTTCMSEICGDEGLLRDETRLEQIRICKENALLLNFESITNMVFSNMSFNVPYLASEKWAVPEVIQYELLSVRGCHPEISIDGIYIDPRLNCLSGVNIFVLS